MPDKKPALDEGALRDHLAETVFSSRSAGDDHFGLEIELIPVRWGNDGDRPRHVPLREKASQGPGTLELVSFFAREHGLNVKTPEGHRTGACPAPLEGDFTFEPGGQVEFSSAPRPTPAAAFHEAANLIDALITEARRSGIEFHTIGFNPWLSADEIGLNTEAARYQCMDAVYESIGPFGRRKMRQSATVHVNIDFGGPERMARRWRAAQLLAPLAMATFAFSPLADSRPTGFRSFRGRTWTSVEPSRCGFPARFLADDGTSPVDQYLDFALDARVLMLERDGEWVAQTEPLSFRRWLTQGAQGKHPTLDDWSNHLTTLFPEVRPRGFLELRSADSQPRAFWAVPLMWWTALLCDDDALAHVLETLGSTAGRLQERYLFAARDGLSDTTLGNAGTRLFRLAEETLSRFPADFFSGSMQRAFAIYGEHFTLQRRSPADVLLERVQANGFQRETLTDLHDSWNALVNAGSRSDAACTGPERGVG